MGTSTRKRSEELVREIRETRRDLETTMDEIETKLRPSKFIEEVALHIERMDPGRSSELARSLGDLLGAQIRRNPVPALILAVGTGLAVIAFSRPRQHARANTNTRSRTKRLPETTVHEKQYEIKR